MTLENISGKTKWVKECGVGSARASPAPIAVKEAVKSRREEWEGVLALG